jgi:hypothetical protein
VPEEVDAGDVGVFADGSDRPHHDQPAGGSLAESADGGESDDRQIASVVLERDEERQRQEFGTADHRCGQHRHPPAPGRVTRNGHQREQTVEFHPARVESQQDGQSAVARSPSRRRLAELAESPGEERPRDQFGLREDLHRREESAAAAGDAVFRDPAKFEHHRGAAAVAPSHLQDGSSQQYRLHGEQSEIHDRPPSSLVELQHHPSRPLREGRGEFAVGGEHRASSRSRLRRVHSGERDQLAQEPRRGGFQTRGLHERPRRDRRVRTQSDDGSAESSGLRAEGVHEGGERGGTEGVRGRETGTDFGWRTRKNRPR